MNKKATPDILVYCGHFKMENEKKWGYEWKGFCCGKRFHVVLNPYEKETFIDKENGIYNICENEQRKLLPPEIKKLIHGNPLPNEYFIMYKQGKSVSIEVVMMLIEKGYDIFNVVKNPYIKYINGGINPNKYLCQYLNKDTREIIVEILEDESVLWKGDVL